ncbi:MAG: hypothetical protein IIC59_03960 [Proteobacteria bacterium]|nr:hypothetical protein [Pseudomonadota bacterium]
METTAGAALAKKALKPSVIQGIQQRQKMDVSLISTLSAIVAATANAFCLTVWSTMASGEVMATPQKT